MHPDRQKEIMIEQAEYEMTKEVLVIDFQKIEYYLTKVHFFYYTPTVLLPQQFVGYCSFNNTSIPI